MRLPEVGSSLRNAPPAPLLALRVTDSRSLLETQRGESLSKLPQSADCGPEIPRSTAQDVIRCPGLHAAEHVHLGPFLETGREREESAGTAVGIIDSDTLLVYDRPIRL